MKDQLTAIGFTANEADVYLALRELGKTKVGPIVTHTQLHRTLIYRALATLEKRRLVTKVLRGTVSYFQATDPIHLLDGLQEMQRKAQGLVERLKRESAVAEQEIVVFEGREGVLAALAELPTLLKKGEEYFVLGSGGEQAEDIVGKAGMRRYIQDLADAEIRMRILMYQSKQLSATVLDAFRSGFSVEEKVIPYETVETVTIIFTKEYVWFFLYEEPYTVIRIHNPVFVTSYRTYFELLWEQAAFVYRGVEAFEQMHWSMLAELEPGDEYHVLGGSIDVSDRRSIAFFKMFHDRRVKKGVKVNMLSYKESIQIRQELEERGDIHLALSDIRPFPKAPRSPLQVNLYNGKVLMMVHGDEPVVMLFDRKEVYEGFRSYFDELWDQRAVVYSGGQGVQALVDHVCETGGVLHVIASTGGLAQFKKPYAQLQKAVRSGHVDLRMLVSRRYRGKPFTQLSQTRVRYVAPDLEAPMATWIFKDTVAQIRWEDPQTTLMFKDSQAAVGYRDYYKLLELKATI